MKTPNYLDDATAPLVLATAPEATQIWATTWTCPKCTLINSPNAEICEACTFPKALLESPPSNIIDANGAGTGSYDHGYNAIKVEEIEGDEDPLSKKRRRRRRRRWRMAGGTTAGVIIGAVLFCGPWGAVAGGVLGGAGARFLSKRGEKKKDLRVANYQLSQAVIT